MRRNTKRQPNNQDVFTFQAFHDDAVKIRYIAKEIGINVSALLRDAIRFYLDCVESESKDAYIKAAARLADERIQIRIDE